MASFEGRSAYQPIGYKMVDSFTIKNFRSFDDISVKGCGNINLIVGENGSGKTALLEALFLAAGISPDIIFRTRSWRGQEASQVVGTRKISISRYGPICFLNFR